MSSSQPTGKACRVYARRVRIFRFLRCCPKHCAVRTESFFLSMTEIGCAWDRKITSSKACIAESPFHFFHSWPPRFSLKGYLSGVSAKILSSGFCSAQRRPESSLSNPSKTFSSARTGLYLPCKCSQKTKTKVGPIYNFWPSWNLFEWVIERIKSALSAKGLIMSSGWNWSTN